MLPLPPFEGTVSDVGLTVIVQPAAACDTVNVEPAIVSVADLGDVVVLAATLKPTDPLPLPLAPLVIVTHDTGLEAVHAQPAATVTVTVPDPPLDATDWLVGEIVGVHVDAGCVTVNVLPPMVSVPVRAVDPPLAAALNVTVPAPEPDAPPVTVSHASLLIAAHAHDAEVVTVIEPVPPVAATDCDVGEIVYVQPVPACVTGMVRPPAVIVAVLLAPPFPEMK